MKTGIWKKKIALKISLKQRMSQREAKALNVFKSEEYFMRCFRYKNGNQSMKRLY